MISEDISVFSMKPTEALMNDSLCAGVHISTCAVWWLQGRVSRLTYLFAKEGHCVAVCNGLNKDGEERGSFQTCALLTRASTE